MAAADEWAKVTEAFDRLERHRVLHPTLAAMRKLADMVKHDAAFCAVRPHVSLASLVLSRGDAERRVDIAWHEDGEYRVAFLSSQLEFSESTTVREDGVIQVLREYLARLDER